MRARFFNIVQVECDNFHSVLWWEKRTPATAKARADGYAKLALRNVQPSRRCSAVQCSTDFEKSAYISQSKPHH